MEAICSTMDKIESFYYMLWKIMYAIPAAIRYVIEILIILGAVHLFICIIRQMGRLLCFGLEKLAGAIISIVQCLLILPFKWSGDRGKNNLAWIDESLNLAGEKWTEIMQAVRRWLKEEKIVKGRNIYIFAFVILFIGAMLPELGAVKSLNDRYRTSICIVQNQLEYLEHLVTPKINEYPEIFVHENEKTNTDDVAQEIYLKLNKKGETGANIRKGPSLDDESIAVINSQNKILYLNERQYDGTRYWLKVQIDDGKIIGWMSENLVETE